MPDGNITAIIQGRKLMQLTELVQEQPYLKAKVIPMEEVKPAKGDKEFDALAVLLKISLCRLLRSHPTFQLRRK